MKKRNQKKYKSVITTRIIQSMKKLAMSVFILIVFSGVTNIGGTNAGFSDLEESTGNIFSATSLDARATYIEYFSVIGMNPRQKPDQRITFTNEGVLDFRYSVKYRKTSGDDVLCDAFLLTAERNGVKVYDKLPLKDFDVNQFSSNPFETARFGEDDWDFTAELPADAGSALENKTCQWNFDFTAWQTNLPDATQGFSDVESVGTQSIATGEWLTSGDVVINEVMWMGSTVSSADEWIELKNMTGSAIPLAGWKLDNVGSSHSTIILPLGAFIPANGYYLIANYAKMNALSALNVTPDYVVNLSLTNSAHGNIVLKNNTVTPLVIDSALGTPVWPAGDHGSSTAFEQSMERNDIPGNGLLAGSWHTCVSGVCNDGTYWDTVDGNNFGTPLASNLSPIVMNEFVPNPVGDDGALRPDGEWIELYNILDTPIDVAGWYFTNSDGDKIVITPANTASGETLVPGKGRLVVYLEQAFLNNDVDTLSLYTPLLTPDVTTDDVEEDVFSYQNASLLSEGKSFARFPDGSGIWLDPEATPGEENVMNEEEMKDFRLKAYDACFAGETLEKNTTEAICSPIFLTYIGMLEEADDTKITDSAILEILEMMRLAEEKKLADLLVETAVIDTAEIVPAIDTPMTETAVIDTEIVPIIDTPIVENPVPVEETLVPEPVVPEENPLPIEPVTPEEVVVPEEVVTTPPQKPIVEVENPEPVEGNAPADEIAPIEETPAVIPEETPATPTPVN